MSRERLEYREKGLPPPPPARRGPMYILERKRPRTAPSDSTQAVEKAALLRERPHAYVIKRWLDLFFGSGICLRSVCVCCLPWCFLRTRVRGCLCCQLCLTSRSFFLFFSCQTKRVGVRVCATRARVCSPVGKRLVSGWGALGDILLRFCEFFIVTKTKATVGGLPPFSLVCLSQSHE